MNYPRLRIACCDVNPSSCELAGDPARNARKVLATWLIVEQQMTRFWDGPQPAVDLKQHHTSNES